MSKRLKACVNHPDRPTAPQSYVLCVECVKDITAKMERLVKEFPEREPRHE